MDSKNTTSIMFTVIALFGLAMAIALSSLGQEHAKALNINDGRGSSIHDNPGIVNMHGHIFIDVDPILGFNP